MKIIDFRLVSIGEAANFYGVSVPTMRRWDKSGKLKPTSRTLGSHRRYQLDTTTPHNYLLRMIVSTYGLIGERSLENHGNLPFYTH